MQKPFSRFLVVLGLGLAFVAQGSGALASSHPIEPFFGHYHGTVSVEGQTSEDIREVDVRIYPEEDDAENFRIDWETIIHRKKEKATAYSIHFAPSDREDIYASAMRKNMFGNWVPLNPLKGDPYVWARLKGNTLTVYAMIITDDGGYEMQQYDRTLRDDGHMKLIFTRIRNGERLKTIEGLLMRKDD